MKKVRLRADVIYDVMLKQNITQRELAQRAGISHTGLSLMLHGHRCVGPSVRSRLLSTPLLEPLGFDGLFEVQ